jgi:threonine dehydratase
VNKVDAVLVPVGGGGLIAGVALAIKTLKPEVLIIGMFVEIIKISIFRNFILILNKF